MHALRADVAFDGERFLPDGATVLVQDGAILAVEPARVDPPAGCPLTMYHGTLLAGLVDGHVHLVADATMGRARAGCGVRRGDPRRGGRHVAGAAGRRRGHHGGGPRRPRLRHAAAP